jgi:CheY-like chemotaxis protein
MSLSRCDDESRRVTVTKVLGSTVLVVDDDENFRDLARQILEARGFDVVESVDVEQCLCQLRSHTVDVVILDIVMPERDGIEALTDIKAISPGTKIVTVSGAVNSKLYLSTSAWLGADASLDKSKIASLCALLNVVLDR